MTGSGIGVRLDRFLLIEDGNRGQDALSIMLFIITSFIVKLV